MAIVFIDKGAGLFVELSDNGYHISDLNGAGVWAGRRADGAPFLQADEDAVNAIISAYDELPDAKAIKVQEIKDEAVPRAQAFLDFIDTFATLQYNREVFLSIAVGARTPTANMTGVQDVTTAAINAVGTVNGLGSVGAVEAYDVVNDPAWP